jgi:hypothetical protein
MQVSIYKHDRSVHFPVFAEIVQDEAGSWVGFIEEERIGAFRTSELALEAMRLKDPRIAPDLLGNHWKVVYLERPNSEGDAE